MLRSQLISGQPVPGMTVTTPSSPIRSTGRKDVAERESRQPMLVARSPFPDAAVETDMMKRTLPPSTRSSTHPSMLTSSHPPLSGSSYPSLPSSAHPPLSSSSHLSAVSSQAYIHGFHSTRENDGQPSVSTGHQNRPHHSAFLSASQPLQRSFSHQPRVPPPGGGRGEFEASGIYSTEHAQKAGVMEPVSGVSQRRYSVGQVMGLSAVKGQSAGSREQLTMSAQHPSGDHGRNVLPAEWMVKSGYGPGFSGGMEGGVAGGGDGRRYTSEVENDPRRSTMQSSGNPSGNPSMSLQDYDYDCVGYSSLDDLSSSLHSLSNPAPSRPPPSYPPIQHHSPSHHSHLHALPAAQHVPSSHLHAPLRQQPAGPPHMARPHPHQLSDPYHPASVPTGDVQSLDTLPSHGNYRIGHQRQPILLPPSLSSSGIYTSSSGGAMYSSEHARRDYREVGGGRTYSHELPVRQYQGPHSSYSMHSAPQHAPHHLNPGSTRPGSFTLQGGPSYLPRPLPPPCASQFAPSLESLDSQESSLEGDSQPQGQSCLIEDEGYLCEQQPMSLQVREHVSPPDSRGSSSAPSSLQSPSHQQQQQQQQQQQPQQQRQRPGHLELDDYLAGQTQRRLTLHESGDSRVSEKSDYGTSPSSASELIEITEHPRDAIVKTHQKAVFTCKALLVSHEEGRKVIDVDLEPQLQWYKGDSPLANEVMKDLILCDVKEEDANSYHCTVAHPHQPALSVCSSKALLTVQSSPSDSVGPEPSVGVVKEPVITSQPPLKMNIVVGEELRLVVEVEGEEPINFKWFKDLQQLDYCHKNVLRVPSASPSDSGQYSCSITNIHGSLLTTPTLIRVVQSRVSAAPQVEGHKHCPTSLYNWEGGNIPDSFLHEIGRAVSYQVKNLGKLASYLSLGPAQLSNVRGRHEDQVTGLLFYWRELLHEDKSLLKLRLSRAGVNFDLLLSNIPAGQSVNVTRNTVLAKPSILVHPYSQQVLVGQELYLNVETDVSPQTCSFQWYKDHARLEGQTGPKLVVPFAKESDAAEYYCSVTNAVGMVDSDIAFVSLKPSRILLPPSRSEKQFTGQTLHRERPEGVALQQHGGRMYSQQQRQQFASQGHVGDSGYFVNPMRGPAGGGGDYRGVQPPQDWGYRHNMYESATDEDQPGGQGESRMPPRPDLKYEGGEGKPLVKTEATGKFEEKMTGGKSGDDSGKEPPLITEHPLSQEVDIGDPLSLSCRAMGPGELSYMWYFNGLSIATETRPEYFINCFTDEDEGVYYCRVSNSWGTMDSKMAQVRMKEDD